MEWQYLIVLSTWPLLVALAAGSVFTPPLRVEHLRLETWLRPADATVWYRPDEMAQVNQRLRRQANAARGMLLPPVLWDLHRRIASGTPGWIVTRTELWETPDGPFVTTLAPNQAVVIVGTGRDHREREWVHVVTRRARGWMPADAVAHVQSQDERIGPSTRWLTVIAPEVRLGPSFTADMGTRLRYATAGGLLAVQVPIRRPDGTIGWQTHRIAAGTIGRDLSHATFYPGTVPPSRANFLHLAWRFLGRPWALGRTDCSGILVQVAETMGLTMVARHSGDQIRQGRRLWPDDHHTGEPLPRALTRLGTRVLLLGKPGHMAFYLGERDGAHWVFHAVEGYGVIVSPLAFKQLDERFTTALHWKP